MSANDLLIGAVVYHALDLAEQPTTLESLLSAAGRLLGRRRLAFFHGMLAADRFTRTKRADQASLAQLLTDIRGRVFRDLEFHEVRKPGDDSLRLHLALRPAQSARAGSDETVRFPFRVYLVMPRRLVGTAEELISGVAELQEVLQSPYAFIHAASLPRSVLMELTGIPVSSVARAPTPRDVAREERLYRCQRARAVLGDVACGAFWGNLLGEEIVRRLGGKERVRTEAPVARVHDLPGGRLALQLTDEILDEDAPEVLAALQDLERYLSPVSVLHTAST